MILKFLIGAVLLVPAVVLVAGIKLAECVARIGRTDVLGY